MVKVILVYTIKCPFCPMAKQLWRDLQKEFKFDYEEVDADLKKGQELVQKFSIMSVPTTIINDKVIFTGVPTREQAIIAIKSE